ncbi:uncharacterized protein LOC113280118 [Papaver somniferum]|uniref:uncharacterized protein LOC113280118 n=1 Tax=Papaver somniferum TaxID=3469 RepID=UPI000E70122B|nr:uncharacterized protein LOC113280118 [Papaver somniferum]
MPLDLKQAVESLGAKFDALLKVLVESQGPPEKDTTITAIATSSKLQTLIATSSTLQTLKEDTLTTTTTSSTLQTMKEDTVTSTAADNLVVNTERQSRLNDIEEIIQVLPMDHSDRAEEFPKDGGQLMSKDVLGGYKELYNAAIMGDWEVASKFLEKNPEAITKVIAIDSRTLLHVAVIQGNSKCIKEIVNRMPPEILEYKTGNDGCTALHYAAMNGHAKAAEIMVNKNPKLTQIVDRENCIPFHRALTSVVAGQRETATYLYSVTRHEHPSPFSGGQGDRIILHTIDAGFYDIASSIVQRFPELVIDQAKKVQIDPMIFMAKKPFAFASGAKLTFWKRCIYSLTERLHKQIYNDKVKHKQAKVLVKSIFTPLKERMNKQEITDFFDGSNNVMKMAVRHGNVEFVEASGKYKTSEVSKYDCKGNTILHYAAKLASSAQLNLVSGACLQMQREMQWFKDFLQLQKNANGDSAHDIFTKEHKELKEKGEKWLKETSGSCMVVAALITTVAFTSAFTVPGGYISSDNNTSKNGISVFLEENSFMVFAVADALALFSSITSVLMFLAI